MNKRVNGRMNGRVVEKILQAVTGNPEIKWYKYCDGNRLYPHAVYSISAFEYPGFGLNVSKKGISISHNNDEGMVGIWFDLADPRSIEKAQEYWRELITDIKEEP